MSKPTNKHTEKREKTQNKGKQSDNQWSQKSPVLNMVVSHERTISADFEKLSQISPEDRDNIGQADQESLVSSNESDRDDRPY